MRKFLFVLLLCTVLIFALIACNSKQDIASSNVDSEKAESDFYHEKESKQTTSIDNKETETPSLNQEETFTNILDDIDNNPYTTHRKIGDEIIVYYDYSEAYKKLDLSEYSRWGSFGADGIMWVEKSNYAGKQLGYIDYTGAVIFPLSDNIEVVEDFHNGLAIFYYEVDIMGNGYCGIINTEGEILADYQAHAITKRRFLNNGNIFFVDVTPQGTERTGSNAYMFCKATGKFVEMPIPDSNSIEFIDYSDGLILVYSNYYKNPGAKYFDSEGNCVLSLDNSNEYYKSIIYAERFYNGEANITFKGMDDNWYIVRINKSGEWLNEPQKISQYNVKTFLNSTY